MPPSASAPIVEDAERAVLAAVDARVPELVALTQALVRIPSVSPSLPGIDRASVIGGERRVIDAIADRTGALGADGTLVAADPSRPNLVATWSGGAPERGRSLLFNGHVDTVGVGPADAWTRDPFSGELVDGRIYGLGAIDDKGGLAAAVIALESLRAAGIRLAGDLSLHAVVGEELADAEGTRAVLAAGHRADAGINVEPTVQAQPARSLSVMPVSNGCFILRAVIHGRRAHVALRHEWLYPRHDAPDAANAIEKAVELIAAVGRLERHWAWTRLHPLFPAGKFFLHPGYILGHTPDVAGPYFPAESCIVEWFVFHHPDQSRSAAIEEVTAYIRDWCRTDPWLAAHPPELTASAGIEGFNVPLDAPIVGLAVDAMRWATGGDGGLAGMIGGTDATFLNAAGIPTVVLGPGAITEAHVPDEHARVEELAAAARTYAVAAIRWCGLA